METQVKKDAFAAIADSYSPTNITELVEHPPIPYLKSYFVNSNQAAAAVRHETYEEQLVRFQEELAVMKAKYKPFLQEFNASKISLRKTMELKTFQFRYESEADVVDFQRLNEGEGTWDEITIPDYRGPVGRWTGYYRTTFDYGPKLPGKRAYVRFQGVDYMANVYLNGRYVGSHEGFFAPFEFDVTDLIKEADNVLLVEVRNDYTTTVLGADLSKRSGDKIYAATGPGWDDSEVGWHHCPPGAGIYNKVYIETRNPVFISDTFVRPHLDEEGLEAWIELTQADDKMREGLMLEVEALPLNFEGDSVFTARFPIPGIYFGKNEYRYRLDMKGARLWEPDQPWMYILRIRIVHEELGLLDELDRRFGMRKFHMDEEQEPKGTLFLNNRPIILRGANEMGHLQQCVMKEDWEQLICDILIAKVANLNYYRITQRPVQEEIYDYFDRLGMMHQCDFPLFGTLRRNQFAEAVRQAGEMERLIRNHPSSIMVTFINEARPTEWRNDGHRFMYRNELENFFEAASLVVRQSNPDRVIKPVEGDYQPPARVGMPDFHCYTCWYTNHVIPLGKLYRGYLPAIKKGWKAGCGEFGAEGLDPLEVMMEDYTEEWLPADPEDRWTPTKIIKAQTFSIHGDWYEEQQTIGEWITMSQAHQAWATQLMTNAFRRRSDYIVSSAIHLLIDAWPSGWMKTLTDHRRKPKPAFFAYQQALKPLRVNLRCDRWKAYGGEKIEVEVWLLNDTPDPKHNGTVVASLRDNTGQFIASYQHQGHADAVLSAYAGTIAVPLPVVEKRQLLYLDAEWKDSEGNTLDTDRWEIEVFPPLQISSPIQQNMSLPKEVVYLGADAGLLAKATPYPCSPYEEGSNYETLIVSSQEQWLQHKDSILKQVVNGAKVIFLFHEEGRLHSEWDLNGKVFRFKEANGVYFLVRNMEHPLTESNRHDDFSYWYNSQLDQIDFLSEGYIEDPDASLKPILFRYKGPGELETERGSKDKLPVVGELSFGEGKIYFSCLSLNGRQQWNPILDAFLTRLLGDRP